MSGLWQCEDPAEWLRNLEAASERIKDGGKDSLIELDSWFVDEFPANIRSRDQPSLTSEELVKLVRTSTICLPMISMVGFVVVVMLMITMVMVVQVLIMKIRM